MKSNCCLGIKMNGIVPYILVRCVCEIPYLAAVDAVLFQLFEKFLTRFCAKLPHFKEPVRIILDRLRDLLHRIQSSAEQKLIKPHRQAELSDIFFLFDAKAADLTRFI